MKNEAYKALIEIEYVIKNAAVCIKNGLNLPPILLSKLNRLGDLGRDIEAYVKATSDMDIIEAVGKIPRFELQAILSWYDIKQETRFSVVGCIRSLYNVARMGNKDTNTIKITTQETLPKELDTDEAKAIFKRAIEAGFMDEKYKFVGTWYQAAYFAEGVAMKLGLRYKWKPFQTLWGYDKFAQTRRESKERFGKVDKQEDIDKIIE